MLKNKIFVLFIFLLLAVLPISLATACGPKSAPTSSPPQQSQQPSSPVPAGNQPPVITGLTPAQLQVYPSGAVEIQCIASDANGDKLNYTWSATGGNFSGAGSIVTWQAPQQYGTYTITVNVDDGKGASSQSSVTLSVGANQNPTITSLVANPSVTGLGGNAIVACVATDPDGDVVKYTWQADEGSISGVGNQITWFAPNRAGAYNIIVTVSDGKGGETKGNVAVTVTGATKTVTITAIQEETGTVSPNDKDKSFTRAGDDQNNVGYKAFWSFNIWSLNNTEIKDAKLIFTTKNISGNPFQFTGDQSLGGLLIWRVGYSDQLPNFNITGTKLEKSVPVTYEQPTIIDVTPEVGYLVQSSATRFQIEAAFMKSTNGNSRAEWIEWSDVRLEVTYSEK